MNPPWPLLAAAAAFLLAGCQGDLPVRNGDPTLGFGAILVRGRLVLPSGETRFGRLALNFESDSERYIIPFTPGETTLLVVEPGSYILHPTRGPFGIIESKLTTLIEGRQFKTAFPRSILRHDPIVVAPGKIVSVGVLEAELIQAPGERRGRVVIRLDDGVESRRRLIEEKISHMLNPDVAPELRENAVSWTRALDQALVKIQEERNAQPGFKPGPQPASR